VSTHPDIAALVTPLSAKAERGELKIKNNPLCEAGRVVERSKDRVSQIGDFQNL
jgi:hypothetical protein